MHLYVLGAGFSKSVSPATPTMKNLTTELLEADLSSHGYLARYVDEYTSAIEKGSDHYTIESICSALFGTELFRDTTHEHFIGGARIEFLRWLAHNIRFGRTVAADRGHSPAPIAPEKAAALSRFLDYCSVRSRGEFDAPGARLVTLNYDLLIESVVAAGNGPWRCDYHVRLASYDEETDRPALLLPYLKLHGSLNWFRVAGAERNDVASVVHVRPGSILERMHWADPPVFVPMAHARRAFLTGTLFPTLWRAMTYFLDRAQTISFIGYGFPGTDLNLLLEFARHKAKVATIVIKESESTFARASRRFGRLFPGASVVNCDAMEWIAGIGADLPS